MYIYVHNYVNSKKKVHGSNRSHEKEFQTVNNLKQSRTLVQKIKSDQ